MSPASFFGTVALVLAFIIFPLSAAQQPVQEWNRTIGGAYGDGAWSMQQTRDGGYILAGYTASRGQGSDLWLVKVDSVGKDQWNRIFGGSGEDAGYFVQEAEDGGFIVTGTTDSYGIGEERLWLLKTDSYGSKQWDRAFGGFVSSAGDGGWSVDLTNDCGFIATGYTRSSGAGNKDLWLIKTDPYGNKQWERTFGGPKDDVGMSVVQTRDGSYIIAGRTASYGAGSDDAWLLKVDNAGAEQWNKTFGGKKDDVGFQVVELEDGYAVVGRTESSNLGGKRANLLKVDLRGNKVWERLYAENSAGISMQKTSNGGFIIAGRIDSSSSGRDALLIKAGPEGVEEWAMPFVGLGEQTGTAVVESSDGCYLMCGITSPEGSGPEDVWLVKLRPWGLSGNDAVRGLPDNVTINKTAKERMSLLPVNEVQS